MPPRDQLKPVARKSEGANSVGVPDDCVQEFLRPNIEELDFLVLVPRNCHLELLVVDDFIWLLSLKRLELVFGKVHFRLHLPYLGVEYGQLVRSGPSSDEIFRGSPHPSARSGHIVIVLEHPLNVRFLRLQKLFFCLQLPKHNLLVCAQRQQTILEYEERHLHQSGGAADPRRALSETSKSRYCGLGGHSNWGRCSNRKF